MFGYPGAQSNLLTQVLEILQPIRELPPAIGVRSQDRYLLKVCICRWVHPAT